MRSPGLQDLLSRLMESPAWLRHGILILLAALVSGLVWWLTLRDLQASVKAAEVARQLDVVRLGDMAATSRRLESEVSVDGSQHARLTHLERSLVSASAGSAVWTPVHSASRHHALRMALFKPGPLGTEKPYPAQRAQLRLVGNFEALLGFARDLASEGSWVAIESFALTPQPAATAIATTAGTLTGTGPGAGASSPDTSLVLDATLLTLHRPLPSGLSDSDPFRASAPLGAALAQPGTAAARPGLTRSAAPAGAWSDPFQSQRLLLPAAASTELASGLQSSPLSSVRMVGSVQTPGRVAALVQVAGQLHAVDVGDALGNGRGRVVEILADRLTVREPGSGSAAAAGRSVTLLLAKE